MSRTVSEQAVAELVVAWLEALGADVYQEVTCASGIADIVARVHHEIWIIEVKTSPSLALLVQAMKRRRCAHRVFVAAPHTKTLRDFASVAEEIGIGVLKVTVGNVDESWNYPRVDQLAPSRRWNSRPVALARKLCPEHKTHAKAGAVGAGGRWTPFRNTCEQVAGLVRMQPGVTIKEAVESIRHHYNSSAGARSSLAHWIVAGKVPGVSLRDGALYPQEVSK